MDNNVNFDTPMTCAPDWSAGVVDPESGSVVNASLVTLDGLDGSVPTDTREGSVYGAEFMPVDMHTPYYERMLTTTVQVPWLAESEEGTYMNRLKELNEPPVQTYKDLKLTPVSQNTHELVEGFGLSLDYVTLFKILLIAVLLYWIWQLSK